MSAEENGSIAFSEREMKLMCCAFQSIKGEIDVRQAM
jgi:hypothetical protein